MHHIEYDESGGGGRNVHASLRLFGQGTLTCGQNKVWSMLTRAVMLFGGLCSPALNVMAALFAIVLAPNRNDTPGQVAPTYRGVAVCRFHCRASHLR